MAALKIEGVVEVHSFEIEVTVYQSDCGDGIRYSSNIISDMNDAIYSRLNTTVSKMTGYPQSAARQQLNYDIRNNLFRGAYECNRITVTLEKLMADTPASEYTQIAELNEKATAALESKLNELMDERLK